MKQNSRLRTELEEAQKENLLVKKYSGIICKRNRLEDYDSLMKTRMNLKVAGF